MKRFLALMLAFVLVLSCFAGCGKKEEAAAPAESQAPVAEIEQAPVAAPEAPAEWDESQATETLVMHISSQAHTLSKWETSAGDMLTDLCFLVFDPMLKMYEDGSIGGWLAEEYKMADDSMSIYFKLREDVWFTNGSKFNADDVAFTFEQILTDTEHYPDSTTKNWRNYVDHVEVTGEYECTMYFKKLMPEFWGLIVDNSTQIIDKETFEEIGWEAYFASPVGTGPYEFTNIDLANSAFELTIRSDEHGWFGFDAYGSYTNVKNIKVMTSSESQTRIASLKTGEVQIIDAVPTSDVPSLVDAGYNIIKMPPNQQVFLEFNCAPGKAFADQKLREALSLVIDREAIVDVLLDGYAFPAETGCLPGNLGYREDVKYSYDVERAKTLVAESTYGGEELEFIYTTSTVAIANELCQYIQQAAAEVGINLKLIPQDVAVFDSERLAGNCDICLSAIVKTANMWYKTAANVIGDDRFKSGYVNEELKALGLEIQSVLDEKVMDEKLAQMYAIQHEDFQPVLYLYYPTLLVATQGNVSGILNHNRHYPDISAVVIGE